MAFERQWPSVAPQLLTVDGGTLGQIQLASARGFKVGMRAVVVAVGKPNLTVSVKRVMSPTLILVGPPGSSYGQAIWADISAYTTSAGAYIFAEQQEKSKIPANDRDEAVYDTEPTVANRNVLVDQLGRYYEAANPLPVVLSDGLINIETFNAQLDFRIDHRDNFPKPGDVHSSVRIGDGTTEVKVQSNGALSVRPDNRLLDLPHDAIQITQTTPAGDPTQIMFKSGGLAGTTVRTLNIAYDASGNILSVVRT